MLTQTFLLEENLHPNHAKVLNAVEAHQASFTSLKNSLNEARSEWWSSRIQAPAEAYDSAVDSIRRLAQHLGGLRSGTKIQFGLAGRRPGSRFKHTTNGAPTMVEEDVELRISAAATAFGDLVEELGPPMNALAVCLPSTPQKCVTLFTALSVDVCSHTKENPDGLSPV